MIKPVLILLSIFIFTSISYADVYLWEDEHEKVHTTNNIENIPEEYRDMVEIFPEGEEAPLDEQEEESSGATSGENFGKMSSENKIKSLQGSYNVGNALATLKAKIKAKQNKE